MKKRGLFGVSILAVAAVALTCRPAFSTESAANKTESSFQVARVIVDENRDPASGSDSQTPKTEPAKNQPKINLARHYNKEEGLALVNDLCSSMLPNVPEDRRDAIKEFRVEEEDAINAFADGDGNITFFTGILNFSHSDDEIAMVCGHEMAHITNEHIKKSMKTGILATIASVVVGQQAGDTAGNAVGSAIFGKKSRSHERDADATGLFYAWDAGWDPRTAVTLWQRMAEEYGKGNSAVEKFLSTHPASVEREENFKVMMVRTCQNEPNRLYCDEIMSNEGYIAAFEEFESRQ